MGKIISFPGATNICSLCKQNQCVGNNKICEQCLNEILDNFTQNIEDTIFSILTLTTPNVGKNIERILIGIIFDIQNGKYN